MLEELIRRVIATRTKAAETAKLAETAARAQANAESAAERLRDQLDEAKGDTGLAEQQLGSARARIRQLGDELAGMRSGWEAARAAERELATRVKQLAHRLQPVLDEGDYDSVDAQIAAVDAAVDAAAPVPVVAVTAADMKEDAVVPAADQQAMAEAVRGQEQVAARMNRLLDTLTARVAASAAKPKTDATQVADIARDILEMAKHSGPDADIVLIPDNDEESERHAKSDSRKPSDDLVLPGAAVRPAGDDAATLLARSRAVVEALAERRRQLETEVTAQAERAEQLRTELRDVKERSEADIEALEAQRTKLDGTLLKQQERVTELEAELAEKSELVLSGKEIIGHLTDKDRRLAEDLHLARAEAAQAQTALNHQQARLHGAEAANQKLAEALSELGKRILESPLASADRSELEAARVDLEVALSEIPDEAGVPVREGLAEELAGAGDAVISSLAAREARIAAQQDDLRRTIVALEQDRDRQRSAQAAAATRTTSLESELEQVRARLGSAQKEVERLNAEAAARSRDLGQSREEAASTGAELDRVRKQLADRETRIGHLETETAVLAGVRQELGKAQDELEDARAGQRDLAALVDRLAGLSGQVVKEHKLADKSSTQRFTRARQQLEGVAASEDSGMHAIVDRNKVVLGQLEEQIALVSSEMERARGEAQAQASAADQARSRVSQLEVQLADAQGQRDAAQVELGETATVRNDLASRLDQAQADLNGLRGKLEEAETELAGFNAHRHVGQGGLADDNRRLREELDHVAAARDGLEHRLSGIEEEHALAQTALRAQLDQARGQVKDRDGRIRELQGTLDEKGGQRVERAALQAELEALRTENQGHLKRIADLEGMVGEGAGVSGRIGSLAQELRNTQASRDELADRVSRLEEELIGEKARAEGSEAARAKQREDYERKLAKARMEADGARKKLDQEMEQTADLRAERASLEAKLQRKRRGE